MANKTSKPSSNLKANVAGVGGGTVLCLLANNLSEDNIYKSWLLILAPTVAVALSVFWKWLTERADNYLKKRKVNELKAALRTEIKNAMSDPNIPADQKAIMQSKLAAFEQQNIDTLMKSFSSIEID